MRLAKLLCVLALLLPSTISLAQTGKITGVVREAATGEALPGVNVVIEGTTQGGTTDVDGYYTILNVAPGTYALRASFVGYTPVVKEDVRVNIDLTAEVDFELQEETFGLEEMVVTAERPVVQRDISANVANLSAEEIENAPVVSVEEVIELQAGIEPGLRFRGGGANELAFVVDGMSMRDGRNNAPFTGISYTSVDEVQVQTGGFNAEYGNVRSGLINVVTKEGPRDRYTADVIVRYTPPTQRHFGMLPNNPEAYWIRPFLDDPDVPNDVDPAYVGTKNSLWDRYDQRQFPEFRGWNAISEELMANDDPGDDLTPEELQELFRWRHRKSFEIEAPDYEFDGTIGGPVPLLSRPLGDLRFTASYRQTQSAYIVPQQRDTYRDQMGRFKLTSDVAKGMKLTLQGMYSTQSGIHAGNWEGSANIWKGETPAYPWQNVGMVTDLSGDQRDGLFAWHFWNPMDVTRSMIGAELTHTLSASTFYKARVQRMFSAYDTNPGPVRDTSTVVKRIGPMELDEAPYGWAYWSINDVSGLRLGGHWGKPRDSSKVAVWSGRFDLTSQLNRYSQLKAGAELLLSHYDMNNARIDLWHTIQSHAYRWERRPRQGAAYVQNKLEFKGMVANVGLRLDYFDGGGDWFVYDPYERAFSAQVGFDELEEALEEENIEAQFRLSPRVGVSFPITENSKLYFNYGHFYQMLDPVNLFSTRAIFQGAVDRIGNPDHPMPKTVAYELGYEQNLFDQFLLRLTGYYKDIKDQPRFVSFHSLDGIINYDTSLPYNYEDVRGFEVTLRKNQGRWVRGFVNYAYMVRKEGNYGFSDHFENRAEQRRFEQNSRAHYLQLPVPEPYGRAYAEFLVPEQFGPEVLGLRPLGDWRIGLLGEWRAGQTFTWDGGTTIVGLRNNVRWRDYTNVDLRLSKNFNTTVGRAQFFVDVANVFNLRHMNRWSGFEGDFDYEDYMQSLHLPEEAFEEVENPPYAFIPGDDRPGDFRKPGVAYVPIELVPDVSGVNDPLERPLYYELNNERYMAWDGSAWQEADPDRVEQVLDDKAYIDMPNESYHTFLNPRRVQFGLRLSF